MRFIYRLAVLLSTAFIVLFSTGCGEDTPGTPGGVTLPPVISLNTGSDFITFNQDLPLNTPNFSVSISGNDGDAPLRDLAILENGLNIPLTQLSFRTGQTANNPIAIIGADQQGFTYEVDITPSNTQAGPVEFSFRLTDSDNEVATTSLTIYYTVTPPTVELLIEDGFVSSDVTLSTFNPDFSMRLNIDNTEDSLAALTVLEDGTEIDAARLTYNNGAFTAQNPLTLVGAETVGATFKIDIDPGTVTDGVRAYTFRVTDVQGISNEVVVNITYETPPGTAITFDTTGVFFNASGSMNGGLDLDNGMAVAFNSTEAEVQDEGIDLNTAGENWRTQLSSVNDAVLKVADLTGLGENTTWDDIGTQEQIISLFDNGGALTGNDDFPDADGDTSATEEVTEPVQEGDVFVIRRGDRNYLLRIDTITFEAGSNNDSYSVSIKY
ncbi:MAG: hypothetical protein AAGA31_19100 [Bacteroidota bacterium]